VELAILMAGNALRPERFLPRVPVIVAAFAVLVLGNHMKGYFYAFSAAVAPEASHGLLRVVRLMIRIHREVMTNLARGSSELG